MTKLTSFLKKMWLPFAVMTFSWALFSILEVREDASQGNRTIRVYWGATAYLAMAVNLLLASRIPLIEGFFGGLDKAYKQHRQLGLLSMVAALIHFLSPPIFADENCTGACASLLEPSIFAGQVSILLLMVFGVMSSLRKYSLKGRQISYGVWKTTHWIMLGVFGAATFHLMQMPKMAFDYRNFAQALGLMGLGCATIYALGHVLRFRRTFEYEVVSVEKQGEVTIIDARAIGGKLEHRAGQFAFLKFDIPSMREAHPFSISSGEDDENLQFCIKAVGDFTKSVAKEVVVGSIARIEGPYGRFLGTNKGAQTWIAAGIGITPFLSLAKTMKSEGSGSNPQVSLTYISRNEEDLIQETELRDAVKHNPNFDLELHVTKNSGRWSKFEKIKEITLYCGPKPLKITLESKVHKVKSEEFEFN